MGWFAGVRADFQEIRRRKRPFLCGSAGRSLVHRLLADGHHVVDVPAKLAARARLLDAGHGRKTDAHDAHAVAVAVVRARELRRLSVDPELEADLPAEATASMEADIALDFKCTRSCIMAA